MNDSLNHQPLLIIAFARPDGVRRILEIAIKAGVAEIYVSVDGPRNATDKERITEILEVVSEFKSDSKVDIFANTFPNNLGVASGVIHALDWFYSNVPSGIVLEDDIVPTCSFFDFCESALEIYSEDNRVKMISGTQVFPSDGDNRSVRTTSYPMIWGWATWAEDWRDLRSHYFDFRPLRIKSLLDYRWYYWLTGAKRAVSGKVDTWDTPIAFQFYNRGLLSITPPTNLVTNVGADEAAVHTSEDTFPLNLPRFEIDVNDCVFSISGESELKEYNNKLERELFRIRYRHYFSPVFSLFFDFWRFGNSKTRKPLRDRI